MHQLIFLLKHCWTSSIFFYSMPFHHVVVQWFCPSRGFCFVLNVIISAKYSYCIHDTVFYYQLSQSFTINSPSKIIVMGFGLNPSPPGQRVLYSAKVKYNKREHVNHMKNKMVTET